MNQFIFSPTPIGPQKSDLAGELLDALDHVFLSIVKIELDSEEAVLLHSLGYKDKNGCVIDWNVFLRFYEALILPQDMEKFSSSLSINHLRNLLGACHAYTKINLACRPETELEWIELNVHIDSESNAAYIFIRHSSDNYLLHRIIDLYVYENCDCFYYIDVEKNSCTMFNGKSDTPLPPAVCTDYSAEIIKYTDAYVVPEDREMAVKEMGLARVMEVLEHQKVHFFTCGMWDKNGNYTYKRLEYRYYDRKRKLLLLTRADITDLYEEHLRQTEALENALNQAKHDSLTQLLNYTGIQTVIEKELKEPHGVSALLFLDLDNFKRINDSQGHMTGNQVLQKVAEILSANIQQDDYAARIGGDEFIVFLSNVQSTDEVAECAKNICNQIEKTKFGDLHPSCSIGVAISPKDRTAYTELMKKADKKLYQAKAYGKNQFVL